MLKLLLSSFVVMAAAPAGKAVPRAKSVTPDSTPITKTQWQNRYHGPEQILTISACDEKGCHYEFKGEPAAPCTDSGQFTFAAADKQEAKATHHIGAKTCQYKFSMSEDGWIEVDDSCVCNVATDADLGGDYKKF